MKTFKQFLHESQTLINEAEYIFDITDKDYKIEKMIEKNIKKVDWEDNTDDCLMYYCHDHEKVSEKANENMGWDEDTIIVMDYTFEIYKDGKYKFIFDMEDQDDNKIDELSYYLDDEITHKGIAKDLKDLELKVKKFKKEVDQNLKKLRVVLKNAEKMNESSNHLGNFSQSPNETWNDINVGSQFYYGENLVEVVEKKDDYLVIKYKNSGRKIKLSKERAMKSLKR